MTSFVRLTVMGCAALFIAPVLFTGLLAAFLFTGWAFGETSTYAHSLPPTGQEQAATPLHSSRVKLGGMEVSDYSVGELAHVSLFKHGQTVRYHATLSEPAYVTIRDSGTGAVLVDHRYVGAGASDGTLRVVPPTDYDALTLTAYFPQSGRTVTAQADGTWISR